MGDEGTCRGAAGELLDELEKRWVAALRKRYDVVIYDEVLKTVNKHN